MTCPAAYARYAMTQLTTRKPDSVIPADSRSTGIGVVDGRAGITLATTVRSPAMTINRSEKADAARYRWLRERIHYLLIDTSHCFDGNGNMICYAKGVREAESLKRPLASESFDGAIDAAMSSQLGAIRSSGFR